VQAESDSVRNLARVIVQAKERVKLCPVCGALTEKTPCAICDDDRRDGSIICVVERPVDILSIEKSGNYHGKYHVLGGRISPLNGVEPEDLKIAELEQRLKDSHVTELVIALATDVEGDATGYYLAKRLAGPNLKITRIAHGIPAGSGLEFADELTLSRAFEGRREFE
jgi:recombination protein RecR